MAETTLKEQLGGNEIIEAVVDKLRTALRGDCHMNANSAYDWFTATIKVELDMHDTGTLIQVNREAQASFGQPPAEIEECEQVRGELEIAADSPNTVRRDSGQGIPTLTKDEQGRNIVKRVHYKRADAKKGA